MANFNYVAPVITASSAAWADFKNGGLQGILDLVVAANGPIADPTVAPTCPVTAAAGCLAAGTYIASYSWVDAFGESLAPVASEVSFTVTGTAQLGTVTGIPAKPARCQSINIYLTKAGGASQTGTLFATGNTGTTFAFSSTAAVPLNMPGGGIPPINSTGAAAHRPRIYAPIMGAGTEGVFVKLVEQVSNVSSGRGATIEEIYRSLLSWKGITALWDQVFKEINTLVVANYPNATLNTAYTPIGFPVGTWTLP